MGSGALKFGLKANSHLGQYDTRPGPSGTTRTREAKTTGPLVPLSVYWGGEKHVLKLDPVTRVLWSGCNPILVEGPSSDWEEPRLS